MKKNVMIILISVLSVLVVGLGVFIIYDKVISKDNEQKENNNVVEQNFDLVKAKELVDKYYVNPAASFFGGNVDKTKGYITALNLASTDIKSQNVEELDAFECTDEIKKAVSEETAVSGQYECQIKNSNFLNCSEKIADSVSYNAVNAVYKKLYGNDKDIPKDEIALDWYGCCRYSYIKEIDSFVKTCIFTCGGSYSGKYIYGVKNAKLYGDKLIVTVGAGWYGNGILFASDGDITLEEGESKDEEALLNKYLDKLDTYEFEFLYEDNLYKLRDVKKDK